MENDDEFPPHGDPYHLCVTRKVGSTWRFKLPNYVVVSHECGQKPRIKWIAPLPPAEPVEYRKSRRKTRKPVSSQARATNTCTKKKQ